MGIWLIVDSITIFPGLLSALVPAFMQDINFGLILTVIAVVMLAMVYFLVLRFFIFKTDWLIKKLHLDRGFEEEQIGIKVHRSTILSISIIVIGGIALIDAFPEVCKLAYEFLKTKSNSIEPPSSWLIFYSIKLVVGVLLMTYHRVIVNVIEKKRRMSEV